MPAVVTSDASFVLADVAMHDALSARHDDDTGAGRPAGQRLNRDKPVGAFGTPYRVHDDRAAAGEGQREQNESDSHRQLSHCSMSTEGRIKIPSGSVSSSTNASARFPMYLRIAAASFFC